MGNWRGLSGEDDERLPDGPSCPVWGRYVVRLVKE